MKLYKREIRPMIDPPALQGFSSNPYPFKGFEDAWYDEEYENVTRKAHEDFLRDPMSKVVFDERYTEVELPTPKVLDVKPGNIICFQFDSDKCDLDIAIDIANCLKGIVSDDVTIMLAPDINPEVMDKEMAYAFLEKMKEEIDKL